MPLDHLNLDLTSPPSAALDAPTAPDVPAAPRPEPEVMTRVLRLPTRSRRQARSIVKMQLDRLSPLPAAETLFDLAPMRQEGAETVYALGILRRRVLFDPAFADQRMVSAVREIEGVEVTFRFRNVGAVHDREVRYLKHAPRAALIALAVSAVALAANIRAETWREQRLPEIAAAQRLANQQARAAEQQTAARAEWTGLERTDAATRFLCVLSRVSEAAPNGLAIVSAAADPQQVTLRTAQGADASGLSRVGAVTEGPATNGQIAVFPQAVCA